MAQIGGVDADEAGHENSDTEHTDNGFGNGKDLGSLAHRGDIATAQRRAAVYGQLPLNYV